jgi:hypothetical protein
MDRPWQGSATKPLYRGIERLFWKARSVTPEQKMTLWTSVAFHEFVQRPMENKTARPTRHDLEEGGKLLFKVVAVLKPTLCVFLGTAFPKVKALEEQFQAKAIRCGEKINGAFPKIIPITSSGGDCTLVMVKHPSERFSWTLWADFLAKNADGKMSRFR